MSFIFQNKKLIEDLEKVAIIKTIPKESEILYEGQVLEFLPIIISGVIKVFINHKDKELLLYYINANESCIMTFMSLQREESSQITAITQEDSKIALISKDYVFKLYKEYSEFRDLFNTLFSTRYLDMIDTLKQSLFEKLDKRILDHLKKRSQIIGSKEIKITHQELANELGSAREVVSRILKKLEADNLIIHEKNKIILT
jgi:CRP/FNR family transcriptional regulator